MAHYKSKVIRPVRDQRRMNKAELSRQAALIVLELMRKRCEFRRQADISSLAMMKSRAAIKRGNLNLALKEYATAATSLRNIRRLKARLTYLKRRREAALEIYSGMQEISADDDWSGEEWCIRQREALQNRQKLSKQTLS